MGFFENIQEKTQQLKEKTQNSIQKHKVRQSQKRGLPKKKVCFKCRAR